MDSRYDIPTANGEVQCVEQTWYAAKLEKKIAALHDTRRCPCSVLRKLNADDELCFLDGWSNKHPSALRTKKPRTGGGRGHRGAGRRGVRGPDFFLRKPLDTYIPEGTETGLWAPRYSDVVLATARTARREARLAPSD
jgi:hypothetical protein